MRPEDSRPTNPLVVPSRQTVGPARPAHTQTAHTNNDASAQVVRGQIEAIYQQDPNYTVAASAANLASDTSIAPAATPVPAAPEPTAAPAATPGPGAVNMQAAHQQASISSPYERTHSEDHPKVEAAAWQKYHSAWQNYYQQYYERYYVGQVEAAKKTLKPKTPATPAADATISSNEAMHDLRSKLRRQISERATKVRKSRHFIPAMAAVMVMLIFLFLQYNRVLFSNVSAYITPGDLDPATLIVDPSATTTVSAEPRLVIPKISVDVPIIWDADASSQDSLNAAMNNGVVWFNIQGANAKPGQKGNFVLSGHSSNDWLDPGDYKFIFAPLERMKEGDTIYVNYESKRYTYTITGSKVVAPTDVAALHIGTDKPRITLITCTPLGTDLNRLLVFADQVSPDPNAATTAEASEQKTTEPQQMPSNSPTFLERIFGGGH